MTTIASATNRRREQEHNDRAWLAWNIAALGRAKRFPALKALQVDVGGRRRRGQSWQEQLRIAQMMWGKG